MTSVWPKSDAVNLLSVALCLTLASFAAGASTCDMGDGRWVKDSALPWYTGLTCGAVPADKNCARLGRKDFNYQKYRWQPNSCPKYEKMTPTSLVKFLKNKSVLVAGDSVARNMASSFWCLTGAAPGETVQRKYQAKEIDGSVFWGTVATKNNITFYRLSSNTLLKISPIDGNKRAKRIDLDKIDPLIVTLLPAIDIAIFQANAWWTNSQNQYYKNGKRVFTDLNSAYGMGITTLADHMERKFKGKALILSPSSTHYGSKGHNAQCRLQQPLSTSVAKQLWKTSWQRGMYFEQKKSLEGFKVLKFLDITRMSEARADAHMSNSGRTGGGDDCLHWCEAGVTDAWVELIYNTLKQS